MRLKAIWGASEEYWIGIIDATYGIIQTLLVIELPIVILKYRESEASTAINGMHLDRGNHYSDFAISTIKHDIWLHHKVLLYNINKTGDYRSFWNYCNCLFAFNSTCEVGEKTTWANPKKEKSWISYFEHHQQRLSSLHLLV